MMRRSIGLFLAVAVLVGLSLGFALSDTASATSTPFQFTVDAFNGERVSCGGDTLGILRKQEVPYGEPLTLVGWLATPSGVAGYEYVWVPTGGGAANWQAAEAAIVARPDLTKAGIPYEAGHGTAGYTLTLTPPANTSEGYYDVYVRVLTGDGGRCDFLAIHRLRYGAPDIDDQVTRTVSLERLMREGEAALHGAASVSAEGIHLKPGGAVHLGNLYLPALEGVTLRYRLEGTTELGERRAILGLTSSGEHPYGALDEACNMTANLTYGAISTATDGELKLDLSDINHHGDVWLTGWLAGELIVTEIIFTYNGKDTDRVAAKLHLSEGMTTYLSGQNAVTAHGIADPTVGDCLRVEVLQETNDPFVHFSAGLMMEEVADVRLDAAEYKYLVLLLRASPENLHAHMTLYLCAGAISSATEACTKTFTLERDGQWHYYLLDLTNTENWTGVINGWRFDIINGDSLPGNCVDIATVQFFRTAEAAREATAQDPAKLTPYTDGEASIILDMREEAASTEDYTIPSEDTYVETDLDTEPKTEPVTEPPATAPVETGEALTLPGEASTDSPIGSETNGTGTAGRGCASLLATGWPLTLTAVAAWAAGRKNRHGRQKKHQPN